ncbi:grpE protein homolog 2, mitochondrial [Paramormyrops kingsleyae]|uniref:grpE protein homolog 2, mitochondrial n=1 Tax=Paramormyrops kingsleyae TaxID=1676925 RepID=UPI003B9717A1
MAIRYMLLTQKKDLRKILSFLPKNNFRAVLDPYSTAAQQRSTGDDLHSDEHVDDRSHSVAEVRILEIRASKLEAQVRDLTERCTKALADSDMVRRRTRKFVEDAKVFGIQSFCRDLVEVADLLEQATKNFTPEELVLEDSLLPSKDVAHALDRLQCIFTKHGLEKMTPIGGSYDPYQHEIVCHVAAEGVKPGSVAVVKQHGYSLHGRTIRHAHVGIAMETQEQ